ncbi:hypothetical protein CPT_Mano_059 [Achromobacter phage Mano]|uniref:Uncharacterized protein n=1 Tax=Achromobacter phage Mano TaxID=2767570 RepID=A0A7L8G7I3_9CAUD|nr:hypothetical protein KB680_gp32 [Achromobacter phage Mano]QOE32791.1 hypothetical protein CPT_Mano_059 [Achromobacter phage Mano]
MQDDKTNEEIRKAIRHAARKFRGGRKTSAELFAWAFGRPPTPSESMIVAHQLRRLGCVVITTKGGVNVFELTGDKLYNPAS